MAGVREVLHAVTERARWTRTNADMLTNDNPDLLPPSYSWYGLDTGAGAYPIGPNGPHGLAEPLAVVTRATSLIVDPLVQVPWTVPAASGTPRWLWDPTLMRRGSDDVDILPAVHTLTPAVFWGQWIRAALWYGHGPLIFEPDAAGGPLAGTLRVLHPHSVTPRTDSDGAARWVIGDEVECDTGGAFTTGNGVRMRLIVLRNPHSPIIEGRSSGVFELSPDAFALAGRMDDYATSTFTAGVPAGYLKVDSPQLTQDQATTLKTAWMNAHGTSRRSIAVLNSTTDFQPISLSPVDAALAESKRLAVADVAYAFGLDPHMLGVSTESSMTYANSSQRWSHYRASSLGIWIATVEQLLSSLLPGAATVRMDFREYARADLPTRYDSYGKALSDGWLTVDEVREWEGLPPLQGEDLTDGT